VALGGGVLVLLRLSPWLAAVVGMVPLPVLGGAGIVLFGSVAASGGSLRRRPAAPPVLVRDGQPHTEP